MYGIGLLFENLNCEELNNGLKIRGIQPMALTTVFGVFAPGAFTVADANASAPRQRVAVASWTDADCIGTCGSSDAVARSATGICVLLHSGYRSSTAPNMQPCP